MRNAALSLLVLGLHAGVAFGARWTQVSTGITGSVPGVRAVVVDNVTGSTLYAQTAGNGVFKSTDGGASWTPIGNITGVTALALDPTSALVVYAGTGHGVLKTTDGGDSWSFAGLPDTPIFILVVDPITPSTLYAADARGSLYKSTDGGGSWGAVGMGLPPEGIAVIAIDPAAASTLYVVSRGFALYKSTDGGQSWNAINRPFGPLLVIDPSTSPSTLYSLFGAGLSKSTDGGTSWTATGLNKVVLSLAVDSNNPGTLYASTSGPRQTGQAIYKSADGGNTWNAVDTSIPVTGSLVLSPANPSNIYAGTFSGGVFRSVDAGANWSGANSGLRVFGIQVLVADPVDPATIYAGGDEGLFKTIDTGGSWNRQIAFQLTCCDLPPGLPPPVTFPPFPPIAPASVQSLLIDFTNTSTFYVGTHRTDGCYFLDTLLFRSTDGATWSDSITPHQSGCLADAFMAMDPNDPMTIYLRWGDFYDGFGLSKSTDGGATWTFTRIGGNALNALVIDPANSAALYVGTDNGVLQSTDGGASSHLAGLANANVSLLAIDPLQPNVLYAGASGVYPAPPGFQGLFKSTDSGGSWSPIGDGLGDVIAARASANALILNPNHSGVLYLATSGYGVFKSADGGASWSAINGGLAHLDVRVLAITRGDVTTVYAGTPAGVFKFVDDGS